MGYGRDVPEGLDNARLQQLLKAGHTLVADLEPESVLDRLLEIARELTGARYAAIGILDDDKTGLERFVTNGFDPHTQRAIGDLPSGRGVLGVLIDDPRPRRLDDVSEHPLSYGFPPGHPPMRSFLGVPVLIAGEAWGNLYLTEKAGGRPFDETDEQIAVTLAEWASIAILNARLYEASERRREELEQVVRRLEATTLIARAVGGETELPRVLELIVKRGRALLDTQSLMLLLVDNEDLVVSAVAGQVQDTVRERRFAISGSAAEQAMRTGEARRIQDRVYLRERANSLGIHPARAALIAPLIFHGRPLGVLTAADPVNEDAFTPDDERLILGLAASAATAVATAQSVERDRLSRSLEAAEQERRRWARELHDETLQGLAGVQMTLSAAYGSRDPERMEEVLVRAVEQLGDEIDALRALITELRPAALDELGLAPAIEALVERAAAVADLAHTTTIDVEGSRRFDPDLETTAYRVVQEALTNVAKHARAERVHVSVRDDGHELVVEVRDDGRGFRIEDATGGFGLSGMRERVALVEGTLGMESSPTGTRVLARLPIRRAARSIRAPSRS